MIHRMSRSVLIVDDDPAFRRLAARMLTAGGLVIVAEAGDVASAVDAANASRPDAALVDVRLPDGSGFDLAHELSALPWKPRVVVTSSNPRAAAGVADGTGSPISFVAKEDLPSAPLAALFGI
jgi:CheY-like chemotaxis protein